MRIINIASSDTFEDIIEAVGESEAGELVLVVPRSNRVFKSKKRVSQLKEHFEKIGRSISIMSSGIDAVENAKLAGFQIVSGKENKKKAKKMDRDEEIEALYSEKSPTWEEPEKTILAVSKSAGSKKFIIVFLGAAAVSFLFTVSFAFNQARVRVVPQKDPFSINLPIKVSAAVTEPDSIYGLVPGQVVQFEKDIGRTFAAAGEKDVFQKARGRITIYNNYGAQSQILVATTRFQTAEGLVFRVPERVVVPGATGSGDNLKPGQIEVEVVADRAGAEYNIGPSEFRIPGFLGSPRYQGFYAESSSDFSGGFTGKTKVVTKEDVDKAEAAVRQELSNEIKSHLSGLANLKIITEAFEIETENTADSAKANDLGSEFKFGIKAKVYGIAFNENAVKGLVADYVKDSESRDILQGGLELVYSEPVLDKEKQELSLKLAATGFTPRLINEQEIVLDIRGKSGQEVKEYFSSLEEVEAANVYFSPFWMRSAPKNTDRIKVQVIPE